jgi:MFS family permease
MTPPLRRMPTDFWLYFGGQSVSALGSAFTAFALPLLVYATTGSALNLGVAMAVSILPYLLFGFIAGALTDRFDRRRMMIGIDAARALLLLTLPLLQAVGALDIGWIYLIEFLGSTLQIPFDAAEFAGVTHLVPAECLVAANGRLQASASLAGVAGPVLAGLAVTLLPVVDLFLVDAASFAISAILLSMIRRSFNDVRTQQRPPGLAAMLGSLRTDIGEGLAYVWRNPVLRAIAITMSVVNLFTSTTLAQLVLFAKLQLSATNAQVSLLFAAGALGVALISLVAAQLGRRIRLGAILVGALALDGLTVVALGLTHRYPLALLLWAVNSAASVLFNINTASLRQQIVPDRLLGRVMTVSAVVAWSVIPVGAVAGGALVTRVHHIGAVLVTIGAVTALAAVLAAISPLGKASSPAGPSRGIEPPSGAGAATDGADHRALVSSRKTDRPASRDPVLPFDQDVAR